MHFLRDMHIKNLKIPMFYYTRRIYEMKKKKPIHYQTINDCKKAGSV